MVGGRSDGHETVLPVGSYAVDPGAGCGLWALRDGSSCVTGSDDDDVTLRWAT